MQKVSRKNQRKYFRVEKEALVSIRECDVYEELRLRPMTAEMLETRIKNISSSGLLMESTQLFPIGAIVKVEIQLKGWGDFLGRVQGPLLVPDDPIDLFKGIAKVTRIEWLEAGLYDTGLEFIGLNEQEQNWMAQFLLKSAPITRKSL